MSSPLQHVRKHAQLTVTQFGEAIGLSEGMVSRLERGLRKPSADTLLRILDEFRPEIEELGYTLEDLVRGEDSAA